MKVYVVMVCDRHDDAEPHLFTDQDTACRFAAAEATRIMHGHDVTVFPPPEGWLYLVTHATESDSVWVIEKELNDQPVPPPVKDWAVVIVTADLIPHIAYGPLAEAEARKMAARSGPRAVAVQQSDVTSWERS